MHYYGAVYRPPSEAYSLIVQCTLGCSHNKCAFCNMYKDKKFSIRPVEEVLRDLAEARSYERRIERIFLADGDALILPMEEVQRERILEQFENAIPENIHVLTSYVGDELEILDPYGGALPAYGLCYETLRKSIKKLVKKLNENEGE